jgi:hypothetical protein
MFEIDEISHLVTINAQKKISFLEEKLNLQGYTLGFFHPSANHFSIEELLMKKLPNLYTLLYGELNDLCVGFSLKKRNLLLETKIAPRQATGPNWKNFVLGSEKKLGSISQATFKVWPNPTEIFYSMVGFSSLEACYLFEREMRKNELFPRCFGRFLKSKLQNKFPKFKEKYFLVLEWAGSSAMIKGILEEFTSFLGKKHFHQSIDRAEEKKYLSKILREEIPQISWGGISINSSSPEVLKLERELIGVLR